MHIHHSSIPGVQWPAIPKPYAASKLAVLFQLEQTQWWPEERIREFQFRQLARVVEHACHSVPFYRKRFADAGLDPARVATPDCWSRLPLLSRTDVQDAGTALHAEKVPKQHGRIGQVLTSGSTGRPIAALNTELTQFFWRVLTLRDHLWHKRDFRRSFAAIRDTDSPQAKPPEGKRADNWGDATRDVVATGPAALLTVHSSLDQQADWLMRHNPSYLLCYPSALLALARHFQSTGQKLSELREVRAFGEVLEPECRSMCREAWDVPIVDMYSSQEVGYLALQCPEHEHYHVQSEGALVEIVDEEGRQCGPGQIGRVVVTTMHNFAMPLLRYELGDYVEVGEPCTCGRGLPVLKRILGRKRNMFTLPDGRQRWPAFELDPTRAFVASLPVRQYQVIQRNPEQIEILVVAYRPLSETEEMGVREMVVKGLDYPFRITFTYVDEIPRTPGGKFEDFRSDVARH